MYNEMSGHFLPCPGSSRDSGPQQLTRERLAALSSVVRLEQSPAKQNILSWIPSGTHAWVVLTRGN